MRRILAFFQWQASWWIERIDKIDGLTDLKEGLTAYAHRQASIRCDLRNACLDMWKDASVIFVGSGAALTWADPLVFLPSK